MKYSLDYSSGTPELKTNPGYENKKTLTDRAIENYNPPKQLEFNFGGSVNKDPITPTYFQDKIPKHVVEKKIATMGDPKSNGTWKKFVAANKAAEKKDNDLKKMIKFGVENSSVPVSKAPPGSKKHKMDVITYINKMNEIYGNGKENADPVYPSQATPTMVGEVTKRLEESRQMTGEPNTWELMKKTADTPEEKNEIKKILNKEYYKRGPKNMDPEDLKYIGKHKSQIVYPEIKIPHIERDLISKPIPEPETALPLREHIKVLADERLHREQKDWDRKFGRGGIIDLKRPT